MFVNSDSNGLFSAEVQLRANQVNAIYVTATNSTFTAGIPQPLRVLQDSQPPNLFIDFPTNGATLYSDSTVIAGRVGDSLSGFLGLTVLIRSTASAASPSPLNGERAGVRGENGQPSPDSTGTVAAASALTSPNPLPSRSGSGEGIIAASDGPFLPAIVDVGIGNNGTYQRGNVPLVEGTNTITVTATDIHGNTTNRQITVVRLPLTGPRLQVVSGDAQKTNVHRRLSQPLVIRATQADGTTPIANKLVTFAVTRSDGRLLPQTFTALADPVAYTNDINLTVHGIMNLTLRTDANGEARALWAMGGDAGCGNNRVCVMSAGLSNNIYFCASADAALPKQINIGTGNNQKAETGGFLPEPLRAWVNDSCNGNQDMAVTFTVVQGGGRLLPSPVGEGQGEGEPNPSTNGSTSITIPTTRTGHAEVLLQLGPDAGQNIVEANYPGNPNLPATFIAYGVARDPSKPTTLTGLLLDNTSQPIGGATCRVSVGGRNFSTTTDVQGRFVFPSPLEPLPSDLPSGPAQLTVNGSTATNLLGATIPTNSFPALEFSLILIPNAENSLPSPVLLPRLNLANQRLYYGTNDLVLTCEGMEGLKMTIKAGSMKKPDGTFVTPDNPSYVSLNQVHHDNVPMPIPDGASPPFAWTLQPGGAKFDLPVQVEYPNMSGLPAGTIAYFLSYNHDTRRFEIICSGHVREDSSTIVSDPGAGLTLAGWGCNCPPYSVTGECNRCPDDSRDIRAADDELMCDPCRWKVDQLKKQWEASRGQPSAALRHQLYCLADRACGSRQQPCLGGTTWANGFVEDTIMGFGPNPFNRGWDSGPTWAADAVRDLVNWTLRNRFGIDAKFNVNDMAFVDAGASYHLMHELIPSFWRACKAGNLRDNEHDCLFNTAILPCFDEISELSPEMRDLAKKVVPELASLAREAIQRLGGCNDEPLLPNRAFALAGVQGLRERIYQPAFDNQSRLVVNGLENFVVSEGSAIKLTVRLSANLGIDLTPSSMGTQYHVYSVRGAAQVDSDGVLSIGRHVQALAGIPTVAQLIVKNGNDAVLVQFAIVGLDRDGDGLSDDWEVANGLDPSIPNGLGDDRDGDGVPDIEEAVFESSPSSIDSDSDGIPDAYEINTRSDPSDFEVATLFPDQTWTFSANGQARAALPTGRMVVQNISAPDQFDNNLGPGTRPDFVSDDYVRVIGTSTVGGTNRYAFSEFFQIRQGQTTFINDLTFTDIPPRKPESVSILPSTRLMTGALGQTNQMQVIARFTDGGTNNVASHTAWTTYRVSNPSIATVTPDGGVIGKARGVVSVTAVNEGASATVQIAVSPNDTLTTVVGVVRDTNGVPLAAATVSVGILGITALTDAGGRFSIAGVATGLGQLTVTVLLLRPGDSSLVAVSALLTPIPGGVTDAGEILARPGFPGMVYIPPGTFVIGSPVSERLRDSGETQHTVTLTNGFWMGQKEVTQGEWIDVMGSNPSAFQNGRLPLSPGAGGVVTNELRHPVEQVSWIDATNYCARLTSQERLARRIPSDYAYRLPTESEWEYACRGRTTSAFYHGKAIRGRDANFFASYEYDADVGNIILAATTNYLGRTSLVGSYVPNEFGLYDMHGNVWEWCSDWYGTYPAASVTNPVGPTTGINRIHRGGSWGQSGSTARSARRGANPATLRNWDLGFRVVLSSIR